MRYCAQLFLVMILVSHSLAADWKDISDVSSRFDASTLVKEGSYCRVWVMRVLPQHIIMQYPKEYPDPNNYAYSMLYNVYECNTLSVSTMTNLNYSSDGTVMWKQESKTYDFRSNAPESNGGIEAKAICDYSNGRAGGYKRKDWRDNDTKRLIQQSENEIDSLSSYIDELKNKREIVEDKIKELNENNKEMYRLKVVTPVLASGPIFKALGEIQKELQEQKEESRRLLSEINSKQIELKRLQADLRKYNR